MTPDCPISAQPFCVGDVDAMAQAAIRSAKAGRNVYVEGRTITPGLPPGERGKIGATVGVFALVVDRDADTRNVGKAVSTAVCLSK